MAHPLSAPLSASGSASASATVTTSASNFPGLNKKIETTENRPPSPTSKEGSRKSEPDSPLESDTDTAHGPSGNRLANFLNNTRLFFNRLWQYKLDVGMGLFQIAAGLVLIFFVDLPFAFAPETVMKGLPFFMIGAGSMQIVMALRRAYVDTCNCNFSTDRYIDKTEVDTLSGKSVFSPRQGSGSKLINNGELQDSEDAEFVGSGPTGKGSGKAPRRIYNSIPGLNPASNSGTDSSSTTTTAPPQNPSQHLGSAIAPDPQTQTNPNLDASLNQID